MSRITLILDDPSVNTPPTVGTRQRRHLLHRVPTASGPSSWRGGCPIRMSRPCLGRGASYRRADTRTTRVLEGSTSTGSMGNDGIRLDRERASVARGTSAELWRGPKRDGSKGLGARQRLRALGTPTMFERRRSEYVNTRTDNGYRAGRSVANVVLTRR